MITRILVDGDACPVVDTIVEVSAQVAISVLLFRSYDHFTYKMYPEHVHIKYIDGGRDAVDFALLHEVQHTDIVVTQDYGLASLVLNKATTVLHHTGYQYTTQNIEQLLLQRFYNQQERQATKRYGKGPKPFTHAQRQTFKASLLQILKQQTLDKSAHHDT
ncbi:YaiI/YqxD family protein [Staphylococcus americanisciuri]|uniref:UPF0178 protein NXS11_06005 n=1 Tax=Staphylococcus americanisciuri TaxID=2973940 RepID=A0ABT2F3J6_9STAP|nr:YaiI/YqxD family protein [Staphylococcus americanisciuri]MCS4486450.1 YaiI/YqxD family protein [Staphylococcus americanisciuri]